MRRLVLQALALAGLFICSYLLWSYTSPSRPMVCMGTGCDVVRASPFAHVWGLPMPLYGVAMYVLLVLVVFIGDTWPERQAFFRLNAAVVSGAGFIISLYLTGVEAFVLHAWCAWCVASAITVTLFAALALRDALRPNVNLQASRRGWRGQLAVCGLAVVAGLPSFYWLMRHGAPPPAQPGTPQALAERLIRANSHSTGNPNAPITIVEFGDFECPYCGDAEKSVESVQAKYGGRIRLVFRHFPVWARHPYAERAAEASECAADQGKFWEAAKKFYDRQSDLSDPALIRYAQEIGLDMSAFKTCLASGGMAKRVREDYEDGWAVGVRRTPTFFVGARMVEGALDASQFSELIDQELARQGAKPPSPPSGQPAPAGGLAAGGLLANPNDQPLSVFHSAATCSEEDASKPEGTLIHTPEAKALFESGSKPVFVDVRPASEFATEHIAGAQNLPLDKMAQRSNTLPQNHTLVLYESGRTPGDICAAGRAASRILIAHGYPTERVKVYQEGLAAWEKAGLPVAAHTAARR